MYLLEWSGRLSCCSWPSAPRNYYPQGPQFSSFCCFGVAVVNVAFSGQGTDGAWVASSVQGIGQSPPEL